MKTLFESYAEMQEQLKGKQHKIDKNKNGKIDAHDFKLLQQEEETSCKSCGKVKCGCDDMKEATEPPFDGPYTTTKGNITDKSGAVHSPMSRARDLARKALQNTKQKKYGVIQGHERFTSIPDKLKQSHFGKTNEEVDLEEVLKVSDGAGKWISDFVHSQNPKFAGKSKKERQQMALGAYYAAKKGVKEEVENIEELNKSTLGSYAKKASLDSAISKKIAADFQNRAKKARSQDMKDANTSISNDFNNKSWKRQDNVNKAIDRLTKEDVEEGYIPPAKPKLTPSDATTLSKVAALMAKEKAAKAAKMNKEETELDEATPPKNTDIADKSYLKNKPGIKSDLKNLGRFLTGKKETNEETMKTFKEFAMMLEMEFKNGRYVHKGKYGTSYDDPEGKEDNDSTQEKEPAVKRGRGRPAGAKSGARQLGGASKKGSGVEYTGYKLHLPNSNKSY